MISSAVAAIKAGQKYRWIGLPGQEMDEEDRFIVVDSMTASCMLNARIMHDDDVQYPWTFVTIHSSDLAIALEAKWLTPIE